jgi:pimeloyl-ACP methyl ester carboxylesterase
VSEHESLYLDVQGIKTHLLRGGRGPDLVYVHGAGLCEEWYPHHAELAKHFTVYAADNPGWGKSDNAEWMDEIQDYVLFLDALLRTLGLKSPILVGHSLGGLFAAEFAATYTDRLAALALVDAAGMPFTAEDDVPDFFAVAGRGGLEFAQMVFNKLDVAAANFNYPPTHEDLLRFHRELTSTARLMWEKWFDAKLPRRLPRIQTPTAVIWGQHERLFPIAIGRRFAELIPSAEFRLIEDAGHMAPLESPETFAEEILRLKDRVTA